MNIKILDSWLRDHLKTNATAHEIARVMSQTSVSIERVEPLGDDFVYDIEVTTNRPDLLSVVGLAREAATVLPEAGFNAAFIPLETIRTEKPKKTLPLTITNDKELVGRICAIIMDVKVKPSPEKIQKRLEASDIRSLNNVIDVTNYIMRTIGHPAHVFDYDRLSNQTLRIRESKKGEQITTLDGKTYTLPGGDIIADDGDNTIVDLLGIMGLQNSVVTNDTKRIVLFIDNMNVQKIRKTSMTLGIRTDAAQMNEKGIDPELAMDALLYGIAQYKELAEGQILSDIIDMYPAPYKKKIVSVTEQLIQRIMGIPLSLQKSAAILEKLGFDTSIVQNKINATVPSYRALDIDISEDLVEEIARVYGYHNLPSELPPFAISEITSYGKNPFYWEERAKNALKYWGYTEVYTYPMVSENMYEGPHEDAVKLANPLGEEFVYMRKTLVPNLLKVMYENKNRDTIKIFEIANVYEKNNQNLPREIRMFAGLIKNKDINFFKIKGLIEQMASDFGINEISFKSVANAGLETEIKIGKKQIGVIEILDNNLINFELNFELLVEHANLQRTYTPSNKYPSIFEDITVIIEDTISTGDIIDEIRSVDKLVSDVSLMDKYNDSRTFHITYQHPDRNLTSEQVTLVRKNIIEKLEKSFSAKIK